MAFGNWMRNHSSVLELAYRATHRVLTLLGPILDRIGYGRVDRLLRPVEEVSKFILFDCKMCGQCILHATGMTCPMTCPKSLRNGPCGGVRANGNCEVIPEMKCIWVEAYERSLQMPVHGDEILHIQPPVNRQLEGSSAWVNTLTGQDREVPPGWAGMSELPVIRSAYKEQMRQRGTGSLKVPSTNTG